jgi:nucleotide-binding universal stress UspA family protein
MRCVLLAFDGSQPSKRALRYLLSFIEKHGALTIHLINVEAKSSAWDTCGLVQTAVDEHLEGVARQALQEAEATLGNADVSYQSHAFIGDPAETISAMADKLGCDTILMGRRGLSAVTGIYLGAVATKLLNLSSLPVLLIK